MGSYKIGKSILYIFETLALITIFVLLFDSDKPEYYQFLFLLPLMFSALSIIFYNVYDEFFKNLGFSLLLGLMFFRMVISPLVMAFGGYTGTILLNVEHNTDYSILLICYEALAIFCLWTYKIQKSKQKKRVESLVTNFSINKTETTVYALIIVLILLVLGLCVIAVPEVITSYRTIFNISDRFFTNYEDSQIDIKYSHSFWLLFAVVTGRYLLKAALIIVPAFFVVVFEMKGKRLGGVLSFCISLLPLFFIGGGIARSLIYTLILFLLRSYMRDRSKLSKDFLILLSLASLAVIFWWLFRLSIGGNRDSNAYFSKMFVSYFSGTNIVSGSFNLPNNIDDKIRLLCYDYLSTFPYGSTIFGLDGETVQTFFNFHNSSTGQIPTTIGMGWYYFGPIFAPIYSLFFASVAFSAGTKLKYSKNPFSYVRLLLTVFYFSMGVIMYNIEITFTNYFSLILPMLIIEKLVFKNRGEKEEQKNASKDNSLLLVRGQ